MLRTLEAEKRPAGSAPSMQALAPRRIRPRHKIAVMLHESGMTNGEIAKALGYTESRVSIILNAQHPELRKIRTEFGSQVADRIRDVSTRLKLYAPEMLDVMVHHARDKAGHPELSQKSAKELLHMAGFSPVKKVAELHANVPVEELRQIAGAIEDANAVVTDARFDVQVPA